MTLFTDLDLDLDLVNEWQRSPWKWQTRCWQLPSWGTQDSAWAHLPPHPCRESTRVPIVDFARTIWYVENFEMTYFSPSMLCSDLHCAVTHLPRAHSHALICRDAIFNDIIRTFCVTTRCVSFDVVELFIGLFFSRKEINVKMSPLFYYSVVCLQICFYLFTSHVTNSNNLFIWFC